MESVLVLVATFFNRILTKAQRSYIQCTQTATDLIHFKYNWLKVIRPINFTCFKRTYHLWRCWWLVLDCWHWFIRCFVTRFRLVVLDETMKSVSTDQILSLFFLQSSFCHKIHMTLAMSFVSCHLVAGKVSFSVFLKIAQNKDETTSNSWIL